MKRLIYNIIFLSAVISSGCFGAEAARAHARLHRVLGHVAPLIPIHAHFKPGEATGTATEVHLSLDQNRRRVQDSWGYDLNRYKALFGELVEQEKYYVRLKRTHTAFWQAQHVSLRLIPDMLQRIWEQQHHGKKLKDFIWMRHWNLWEKDTRFWKKGTHFKNIHTFFDSMPPVEPGSVHNFNDLQPEVYHYIVSANAALLGNSRNHDEASMRYLLDQRSIALETGRDTLASFLKPIFEEHGFDQSLIKEYVNLAERYPANIGNLILFLVPNEHVDDNVTLRGPWGGTSSAHYGKNGSIIAEKDFDKTKNRYHKVSGFFKQYQEHPETFQEDVERSELDRVQVRILLGKDVMLNPNSGVKMFRLSGLRAVADSYEKAYEKELDALCAKTFKTAKPKNPTDGGCTIL